MDDIQSWWEVPSIAHFCSLFRVAFNLLDFDIEELEEALLTDGAEDSGSSLLQELIVRLLCGCLGNNGISTFNYQMFLRRLFRQKCREYGKENPFNSDIDFQFLPLRTKVEILHSLCDFRLDAEDVMDVLKNLDSDSLRVHPLGYDENRSAYWYFYGTRLYREDYPHRAKKKKKKAREKKHGRKSRSESESEPEMGCGAWQVVCYTESDWERLAYKMEDSQCKEERALHAVLAEDFLPEIPRLFEEKERLQKKRLMEMQPRRQSSRLEKLKHQKEEEKKALEHKDSADKTEVKERERKERERRDRDARRAREHRAMLRSRSHTNSECSSSSQADNSSKPRGRQTNNSLSSATGQIIIQPSRQKLRTSQVFRQSVEDLRTGLYKILDRLKNHEDAWPFLDPVEEEYAPRYYSVIAKPMDLQRMEDKLDAGEYSTFGEFKADFQLIVDNCRQYNGSENEYTEMVGKLQEAFDAAVDRYLETEISTDEEVAVEFPGEQKGRRRKSSQASKHSPAPSHRSEASDNELPDNEEEPTKEESEVEEEGEEEASQKDSDSQSSRSHRSRHKATKKAQETKRPGKKPTAIKNVTDIEALELATEQTLKDINKWLDDTPRFSEFSSASNSPSQLPLVDDCDGVGSRIEHDYRARLKMRPKEKVDFTRRRFFKDQGAIKRRREIQRTIDRLQPGKSKGNLLSNPSASKNEETTNIGGLAGIKMKDQKVENPEKEEQITLKLSLGTVLNSDVIGFGKHSFENSDSEIMKKDDDSQDDSGDEKPSLLEDEKNSPEDEENLPEEDVALAKKLKEDTSPASNSFEKKTTPVPNSKSEKSSTPNLSAWFKAFGLPKSQPPAKKKSDVNDESKEKLEQFKTSSKETEEIISVDDERDKKISVVPPLISPARRQRKASTGSSVSERSSFSQDPTDPMADGSSPRPSLDEPYLSPQADPNKTPYHHSPLNGTIRVGFYQDTSFPRGSSDKSSSPREPPTPNCSPREPPSCSPRDIPSCSPRTPMASPKSDYPLYSASSLPYQSPSVNTFDAPLSPFPAHMTYYDTNKPLTDQYRPTPTATEKSVSSTYPVKKRIINDVEQSVRSSPDVSSYRGGSFTPTRNAIENDRSFTPTPGRIPTQPSTRPTYAPETALALGLHGISPHLMDPYAEERLLSATYYNNDAIYGKNTPSTTAIHSMYPTTSSVMSNAGYARDDRGYTRIPPNFSETRSMKVSESTTPYSSSLPASKTATPVINYSGRSAELSSNAPRSSSPLNYSNHPGTASKSSTQSNINYVNRSQDTNKILESPLDFAKVSQNETTKSKESTHISYPTSRESLPPKISSPYSRSVSDLSASGLGYNHSPDLVSGKLNVPPSPLSYPSQDILAGKVNYGHPMSDLTRFGYPHSVGYNHPMSDLIQAKATSATYSNRPVDLMTGGYNRPLEMAYQSVSRASSTPKPPETTAKTSVKKPSKKRKTSDTPTPTGIPAGFQQYLGQSSSEAIALKTSSVVPGSAFNFGPAPLKDSYASYLEEMRSSNFFAPHPDISSNTKSSSPSPHPPASPFPYLSHAPSRPLSYPHPFMNYPQILQKEELLRPMMLHQGLLPPTGYPPPGGYLGMHDPINRSSWL